MEEGIRLEQGLQYDPHIKATVPALIDADGKVAELEGRAGDDHTELFPFHTALHQCFTRGTCCIDQCIGILVQSRDIHDMIKMTVGHQNGSCGTVFDRVQLSAAGGLMQRDGQKGIERDPIAVGFE